MAGASVISAILNSVGRRDLPFVFGGDGAFVAIPGSAIEATRQALAAVKTWVGGRIAARSARGDRADGRYPRTRPRRARRPLPGQLRDRLRHVHRRRRELGRSADEGRQLRGRRRAGRHAAGPHRPLLSLEPDRSPTMATSFPSSPSPATAGADAAFQQLVSDIVALAGRAGARRPSGSCRRPHRRLSAARDGLRSARHRAEGQTAVAAASSFSSRSMLTLALDRLNRPLGRFDPKLYRSDVPRNSDFRKFDDGLKMTIDVDGEMSEEDRKPAGKRDAGRRLPLRAASPEFRVDDLHRAVADDPRSHAFHRRRGWRLCDGGQPSQGQICQLIWQ